MKSTIIFLLSVFFTVTTYSQETTVQEKTIDYQFRTLYKNSNNYQEYKVVAKKAYGVLHNNVLDSLKKTNSQIQGKNTLIDSQKSTIDTLEKDNKNLNTELATAVNNESSISIFGIQFAKKTYSLILFSFILLLIVALAIFIYKFRSSNVTTTEAKSNLEDIENEFDLFRKKSIEREQKIRRELQDEIIKNRTN